MLRANPAEIFFIPTAMTGVQTKTRKPDEAERDGRPPLSYRRQTFVATWQKFDYGGNRGQLWWYLNDTVTLPDL